MRQHELDLGVAPAPEPPLPLPPALTPTLVRVMAEAIIAVHRALEEGRDAARQRQL